VIGGDDGVVGDGWITSSWCVGGGCGQLRFVRSSQCSGANCVEVGQHDDAVLIRDSKDSDGPTLRFTRDEWRVFVLGVRNGESRFGW
jgi:hypothetical protein